MYKLVRLLSLSVLALFSLLAIAFSIVRFINRSAVGEPSALDVGTSVVYALVGILTLIYTIYLIRQSLSGSGEKEDSSGVLDDDLMRD